MRIVAVYGTKGGVAYSFRAFETQAEAWAWLDAKRERDPSGHVAPQPQRIATGEEAEQLLLETAWWDTD